MWSDMSVLVGAIELAGHAKNVTCNTDVAPLDKTSMQSQGWTELLGGNKSGMVDLTLMQDRAAGGLDQLAWSYLGVADVPKSSTWIHVSLSWPLWPLTEPVTGNRTGFQFSFTRNRFHSKPVSLKTGFTQNRFRPNRFHSKPICHSKPVFRKYGNIKNYMFSKELSRNSAIWNP